MLFRLAFSSELNNVSSFTNPPPRHIVYVNVHFMLYGELHCYSYYYFYYYYFIYLFICGLLKFFICISYYAYVVSNDKVPNETGLHKFSKNSGATS